MTDMGPETPAETPKNPICFFGKKQMPCIDDKYELIKPSRGPKSLDTYEVPRIRGSKWLRFPEFPLLKKGREIYCSSLKGADSLHLFNSIYQESGLF